MSSDELWNCNDISRKKVFVAEIYKKNSKYSLRHLISLPRKERGKEGSSLSQASGCGSASWVVPAFTPSLDFETTFENIKAARPFALLMFQKKVVTWCSQHLQSAGHDDRCFLSSASSSPSSSSWWRAYHIFEKRGCAAAMMMMLMMTSIKLIRYFKIWKERRDFRADVPSLAWSAVCHQHHTHKLKSFRQDDDRWGWCSWSWREWRWNWR